MALLVFMCEHDLPIKHIKQVQSAPMSVFLIEMEMSQLIDTIQLQPGLSTCNAIMQDKDDDVIVGIKSTALRFAASSTAWLSTFAVAQTLLFATAGLPLQIHVLQACWLIAVCKSASACAIHASQHMACPTSRTVPLVYNCAPCEHATCVPDGAFVSLRNVICLDQVQPWSSAITN